LPNCKWALAGYSVNFDENAVVLLVAKPR